jgi:hypothetical protein
MKKKAKAKKKPAPDKTGAQRNKRGRFVKGHAPTPGGGRPKEAFSIKDVLRHIGNEPGTTKKDMTKIEVVCRQVYIYAMKGKSWAVQFIADRLEGRPKQSVEIEDKRGPLSHLQGLSDAELAAMEKELESRI